MFFTETPQVNFLTQIQPPNARTLQEGIGVANGTFGELLQGALQGDNNHFLVTLPIQKFSRAVFTPNVTAKQITVTPANKSKSLALLQKLLDHYALAVGGHLWIESELEEGKGLASSSADLVATARALESAMGRVIPTELTLAILRTIEPTDGVMYPEFVTFFHRKVELGRRLGFPSPLKVLAIDEGGQIDTIEYNRRTQPFTAEECVEYADLLESMESAIRANNLELMGRVATRSAILNQKRNPKRHLDQMLAISEETRALGVVVTHSGPCIGLLFPHEPAYQNQIEQAKTRLAMLAGKVLSVDSIGAAPSANGKFVEIAR